MLMLTRDQCDSLFAHDSCDRDWGVPGHRPQHVAHVMSGACIAIAVRSENVVQALLDLAGLLVCLGLEIEVGVD